MKIAVGLFYLECNSKNPDRVTRDNFIFHEDDAILPYLHATSALRDAGAQIVPTVLASALPAGIMAEDDFWFFADKILDRLEKEGPIDGVWLHLHGALEVDNVGSGDLRLVQEIRRVAGDGVPISLTLDAHANNAVELAEYACSLRGYHTIPHTDQAEAERDAARILLDVVRNKRRIRPALAALPMIVAGEKGLSAKEPLKGLFERAAGLEAMPEIATASVFMGDPWCDCPNSHASVVVVPSAEEHAAFARERCLELAREMFERRRDFAFEVPLLPPDEVLERAASCGKRPVFVSDSGDNTTGGASGEGTEMLRAILGHRGLAGKRILVTPIFDAAAFAACEGRAVGDEVSFSLGTGREEISRPVRLAGRVKVRGDMLGYLNVDREKAGDCVTIAVGDNLDVSVSNVVGSFITPGHFEAAGLDLNDYDIIILKQGYLFAQLRPFAGAAFLALTGGASYQLIEEIPYERVERPIYPLDPDVEFSVKGL